MGGALTRRLTQDVEPLSDTGPRTQRSHCRSARVPCHTSGQGSPSVHPPRCDHYQLQCILIVRLLRSTRDQPAATNSPHYRRVYSKHRISHSASTVPVHIAPARVTTYYTVLERHTREAGHRGHVYSRRSPLPSTESRKRHTWLAFRFVLRRPLKLGKASHACHPRSCHRERRTDRPC